MPEPTFDRLSEVDVPAAFELSARVGWNQTTTDWRRLIALNPDGTVAVRDGGRLVATATLATYGRALHWIGMVIVDPAYRGRGLGTAVLSHVIERSHALGAETLGLDATPLGEPLYRKRGFVPVHPIDRWAGTLAPLDDGGGANTLSDAQWRELVDLDRRSCGVDRASLLNALRAEREARIWVTAGRGSVQGFAVLRPGREAWHLGPLVAKREEDLHALLHVAAEELAGAPVLADAPRAQAVTELLGRSGMELQRRLTRMTHGRPAQALLGETVRIATSLEWG